MNGKIVYSFSISLFLMLLPILVVSADRGMIPVLPDVSVYEPGQKAIIAWNGHEEILILSTDVFSKNDTITLEILPLPSIPNKIEKASFESFNAVQELIWFHLPLRSEYGNETDDVKVIFHEKIGMHDITVVEANNVSELVGWVDEFLVQNGIDQEVSLSDFESVLEEYMSRGFEVYALDLVELSSEQKSVEPILYQFNTTFLYYPLLITSPLEGEGKITLFLLAEGIVEDGYYPLTEAHYRYYGLDLSEPIRFRVSKEELSTIDQRIAELFENEAWMTALTYEGSLGVLTEDVMTSKILYIPTCDLNVDGIVNVIDLAIVAKAFGSYAEHPRWNPKADVDKNGVVDILDIVRLAKDFGKKSTEKTEFQTIEKGYYSGHTNSAYHVINTETEWADVWNQHRSISWPQQSPPKINFSDTTVIAVFMGEFSTGGYGIEIEEIFNMPKSTIVKVEKTYHGAGCIVTQALSQPYHIVRTNKIDKEIIFEVVVRIIQCS